MGKKPAPTQVYVWGSDSQGQLGIGSLQETGTLERGAYTRAYPIPRAFSFDTIFKSCAAGTSHAALITSSGQLFMMGSNDSGKLGLGDMTQGEIHEPNLVQSLGKVEIKQVALGDSHTIAVSEKGDVYGWGNSLFCGVGLTQPISEPMKIAHHERFIQAAAGTEHTLLLDAAGKVYGFGSNREGQIGSGALRDELAPIAIHSLPERLVEIAAGAAHSLFLGYDGTLYVTGSNSYGQLGTGSASLSTPAPLDFFTRDDIKFNKISASNNLSAAITTTGHLFVWGEGFGDTPKEVETSEQITNVTVGERFVLALDSKGKIWSFGENEGGELGLGDFEQRPYPCEVKELGRRFIEHVSAGRNFAIALGRRKVGVKETRQRSSSPLKAKRSDQKSGGL